MTPVERDWPTELLPAVPDAVPDPFPPDRSWEPHHARDWSGAAVQLLVSLLALVVVAGCAYFAGQWSVRAGYATPPDLVRVPAEVQTQAQLTRLWPVVDPGQKATMCGAWRRGDWSQYVVDQWSQHLASPAGGQIDVDRATVARFLGSACSQVGKG